MTHDSTFVDQQKVEQCLRYVFMLKCQTIHHVKWQKKTSGALEIYHMMKSANSTFVQRQTVEACAIR